jgi:hypothetical protein
MLRHSNPGKGSYLPPPSSRRLSEISEILINVRRAAAPSSIHYRTDLYGIFLVRPPLHTLAYFLKGQGLPNVTPRRYICADAQVVGSENSSFRVTSRESANGACKESLDWFARGKRERTLALTPISFVVT